jgi:hypothetical protein
MSIDQTDTIDAISTSAEGKIILTISDHYPWSDDWHLQLLQNKINAYLQFIESGQIFDNYPNAARRDLIIETVIKFEPTVSATLFLEKAKKVITKAGIGFQWRLLNYNH